MNTTTPSTSLRKWLLRIFVGAFLLAILAPIALAVAVFHISGDTRALRNAVVNGDGAKWNKTFELSLGAVPFTAARLLLPFTPAPPEAQQALEALRSAEVSVYELQGSQPDRARILRDADARMTKRGWDRAVCVLEDTSAIAVYVKPEGGSGASLKVSVLVLEDKQMIAVTGHGKLEPLFELAMEKAGKEFWAKRGRFGPMVAEKRRK